LHKRARMHQRVVGLAQNEQGGDDDQNALEHGREVFGLVVPELMPAVGRLRGDVDRVEGDRSGDQVDDAFQRVGIEGDAAARGVGEVLEPHGRQRDADRRHGGPLALVGGGNRRGEQHSGIAAGRAVPLAEVAGQALHVPSTWHGWGPIASAFAGFPRVACSRIATRFVAAPLPERPRICC